MAQGGALLRKEPNTPRSVGGFSQLREVSYVAWHLGRSHRPSHRTFGGRNGNAAQEAVTLGR